MTARVLRHSRSESEERAAQANTTIGLRRGQSGSETIDLDLETSRIDLHPPLQGTATKL
jgi:hypothetical protein